MNRKIFKLGFALFTIVFIVVNISAQKFDGQYLKTSFDKISSEKEIDVVISTIKSDLVDYYPQEITAALKSSYPEIPADKTIRVPPYVNKNRITEGEDFIRVKKIADNLLKYMWLENRVKLIYFNSEVPVTGFSYPYALIVSNAAEQILTDEELESLFAHEIMHLIVQDIYKPAVEGNNFKLRRAVELFCDAGAISILEAKGKNSQNLISALEKMQEVVERVNGDKDGGMEHPTIKQRKQLYNQLTNKFTLALSKAIKKSS